MTSLLCSLFIPIIISFILIAGSLQSKAKGLNDVFLISSLAIGLGIGISSCTYFSWLILYGRSSKLYIIAEITISLILIYYLLKNGRLTLFSITPQKFSLTYPFFNVVTILFFIAIILSAFIFIQTSRMLPDGGWDAWQTWNYFARFIFRGGNYWKDAFSVTLWPHHSNYPFLVPASVARCWEYMGYEDKLAPISIAMFFTFAIIGLVFCSINSLVSKMQGYLASFVLLGTTYFIILGTFQFADIPLSFYFLATLILLSLQERSPDNFYISAVAGMMTGLSCWTKNEGLLFFISIIAARIIVLCSCSNRKLLTKQITYFFIGSAPALLLLVYFKVYLAPPSDLFLSTGYGYYAKHLTDLSRYLTIIQIFTRDSLNVYTFVVLLLIYPLCVGVDALERNFNAKLTSVIAQVLMLAGYFAIYLVTPYDLEWHLNTSLSRLLMHLWPSFIFTYFLFVKSPEESLGIV